MRSCMASSNSVASCMSSDFSPIARTSAFVIPLVTGLFWCRGTHPKAHPLSTDYLLLGSAPTRLVWRNAHQRAVLRSTVQVGS
jgi:hypothetical protein